MFDRYLFLERVLSKAPTRQRVLDALGLPSSRGPNLFNRGHARPRRLWVEEAVQLSEAFGVPLGGEIASAESLLPVLRVCLRNPPTEWTDRDFQRIAEEIELGLRLRQALDTTPDSQDRIPPAGVDEEKPSPHKRG
jgi:hypothetical protein